MTTTTTYREFEASPTSTGGKDSGKVHRLYDSPPKREERRELLAGGWRPVSLTGGVYAQTSLVKAAMAGDGSAEGRVFVL